MRSARSPATSTRRQERQSRAYRDEILIAEEDAEGGDGDNEDNGDDELFREAIELVKQAGHASASYLQRHLKVGYNRAARMIETMESRGGCRPG